MGRSAWVSSRALGLGALLGVVLTLGAAPAVWAGDASAESTGTATTQVATDTATAGVGSQQAGTTGPAGTAAPTTTIPTTSVPSTAVPTGEPSTVTAAPAARSSVAPSSATTAASVMAPKRSAPVAKAAAVGAPRATISDFDCQALTTTVTLDATATTDDVALNVMNYSWSPATQKTSTTFQQLVDLPAGSTRTIVVRLATDAHNDVWVTWLAGPEFEPAIAQRMGACGNYAYDPRVTAGEADCAAGVLPVTLDNSQTAQAVTFDLNVRGDSSLTEASPQRWDQKVVVPAGETTSVNLKLFANAKNHYYVRAPGPQDAFMGDVVCGRFFSAYVESGDCTTLTVSVELDNTHSTEPTVFVIRRRNDLRGGVTYERSVRVPAAKVLTVSAPLLRGDNELTVVGGPGHVQLAGTVGIPCGEAPSPTATTGAPTSPQVKPVGATEAAPASAPAASSVPNALAMTGSTVAAPAVWGLALVAGGLVLTIISGRRQRQH